MTTDIWTQRRGDRRLKAEDTAILGIILQTKTLTRSLRAIEASDATHKAHHLLRLSVVTARPTLHQMELQDGRLVQMRE
jgi:hypothetical protein